MHETSQSCDRVHLGHLKKKIEKKTSKVEIFTKVKIQNIFRGKLSKFIFAYNKRAFFGGHFCVAHKQTDGQTDGKVGLQSCMSQLKNQNIF